MDEVPGKRRGTRKYIYAGYVYHLDTASAENNIYRCSTRSTSRCTGTARVQGHQVEVVQAHDHAANSHVLQEAIMRSEILQLCGETSRTFDDIYREVSLRYLFRIQNKITFTFKIWWISLLMHKKLIKSRWNICGTLRSAREREKESISGALGGARETYQICFTLP